MRALIVLAFAAIAGSASAAPKPSFDCAKGHSVGERLICRDPGLAAADRDLAAQFAAALKASPDPGMLRKEERDALTRRDACADRACVATWYEERRAALSTKASSPSTTRMNIGACAETKVARTGPRLEGIDDSGSFVGYANGLTQVSYDVVPGMHDSRVGDPVRLCLQSRPQHCPPGDDRGAVYGATNLRTGAKWSAGDSQHVCGGA